ncbi:hypothetical protein PV797_10670 [Clostridiaceae bacterium M8S5]|nr:hypothetical protein PV797_10670 [Clostridiaceae bacterium M8S5]
MKRKVSIFIILCLVLSPMFIVNTEGNATTDPISAIYGGGPFVNGGQKVMNDIKASGFNTVMIWAVHVRDDGDLYLNDTLVCKDGKFVGEASWITDWASLKQGTTSVNRIEISVGAWGSDAFNSIKNLINKYGTGSDTVLYKNFLALKNATGSDAVNYDDEKTYDVASSVKFGKMCNDMGMKVTLCPYTNKPYWKAVKDGLGNICDRVYLQCYAGGAGNNPDTWANYMGMDVIPGLWCIHGSSGDSAAQVKAKLQGWNNGSIQGGFMWLYDNIKTLSSPNTTADYAAAINTAFRGSVPSGYPSISSNTVMNGFKKVADMNNTSGFNRSYGDYIITKSSSYNVNFTP